MSFREALHALFLCKHQHAAYVPSGKGKVIARCIRCGATVSGQSKTSRRVWSAVDAAFVLGVAVLIGTAMGWRCGDFILDGWRASRVEASP